VTPNIQENNLVGVHRILYAPGLSLSTGKGFRRKVCLLTLAGLEFSAFPTKPLNFAVQQNDPNGWSAKSDTVLELEYPSAQ